MAFPGTSRTLKQMPEFPAFSVFQSTDNSKSRYFLTA